MKQTLIYISALIIAVSCIKAPENPANSGFEDSKNGVFVLCEGLLGHDNSSLVRYEAASGSITQNFFRNSNTGQYLGDTANDIVLKGDTAFVVISTPGIIEIFNITSGNSLGRIILPEGSTPRHISIINDSTAYVSDLYDNSITKFNPRNFEILRARINTGPNPEEIVHFGNFLFIANSSLGAFNQDDPKSRTIAVLDITTDNVVKHIKSGPNTVELELNEANNKLYAGYYNIYRQDSLGGIIEYDLSTFEETAHWRLHPYNLELSPDGSELFFFDQPPKGFTSERWKGLCKINLAADDPEVQKLTENKKENEYWYSLGISPANESIWIGNAKNYQIEGEILEYNNGSLTYQFKTGINPNNIIFY